MKYEVVVIDTFNSLQDREYLEMLDRKTMITRDKWRNFSANLLLLVNHCKSLNPQPEIIAVLGGEGQGKSYGIKYLNPETTLWIQADNKPITFKGGRQNYAKDKGNYSTQDVYEKVETLITHANDNRIDKDKGLFIFILGHLMTRDSVDGEKKLTLKTLGNLAATMNVEGAFTNCLYTDVTMQNDKPVYKLRTQTRGNDICRTLEGLFDEMYIDNNFQLIIDAIKKY